MYPSYQYNQQYPLQQRLTNLPVGAIATMGMVGAMLGGVVTAARDMRALKAGEKTRGEVAGTVVKEAVGTAAAGAFFRSGPLALATMAAVGIGTKYLYDGLTNAACKAKATAPASTKPAAKKA